ncbi:NUDIX domain-containing protein [Silvanigrella aquatica]|uniref:Nudix hydrolase domain-containing protein n=1 Tax=Silvanigrella aquatica TaxID=1915309 RepID=A0A1L4D3E4_9BACT|nr:NUDIX domain-containing protein [Silvanigrella aquatica]APJ04718.1 hypothetical protein AXG55_12725 [Silvanigrella aquatica]
MKKLMMQIIYKIILYLKIIFNTIVGMRTNGARALIINDQNEILLVFHTYIAGWHFPGGGVDKGESPREAVVREVREEAGIIVKNSPVLFDNYYHTFAGADDIVCLYVIRDFDCQSFQSSEIQSVKWFSLKELPLDISKATQRRINEYFYNHKKLEYW